MKAQGLVFKRMKGDHEIWDRPDDSLLRPVVFPGSEPEVPPTHLQTNLRTLGMGAAEFEKVLKTL